MLNFFHFSFQQKRSVKKMHLLNDKGAWGLGIQVTGGKDSIEEGNHGIFINHLMDDGAAARFVKILKRSLI